MRAATFNPRASAGFTLIESVVALAILAIALAAIYQIFGWTLRRAADQRQRDRAWLTAQSLLDQMRADDSLAVRHSSGTTPQGQTWEILVESFSHQLGRVSAPELAEIGTPTLLQVTIKVSWKEQPSRHIELRSLEFGAAR